MFFMLFFLVKEKIIRIGSKDLEGEYVGGGLRSSERIILYFEIYKIYDISIYCLSFITLSELFGRHNFNFVQVHFNVLYSLS